jgi:microcystin-dependent protein
MVSTFTPNINLEEPARGDDVGTWDTPVNNNMTLLDLVTGANTTVGIGSGNVTLSIAQYRSRCLTFNSTLIQNTTITFPSTFLKDYTVIHTATGSSAFTITLATTVSGGQVVGIPPGIGVSVYNDGTNLKIVGGLPVVGTYVDVGYSAVPNWVTASTVPPFLNCNGTTFSGTTYPQLAVVLGGTTLPDGQGRSRFALNGGTGRITSAGGGIDGNTLLAAGGVQTNTLVTGNLPAYTPTGTIGIGGGTFAYTDAAESAAGGGIIQAGFNLATITGTFTGAAQGGVSTPFANLPPGYVGGITMIRAA